MIDLVAEYLRIERELLVHRCAERLAGRTPRPDDPFEMRTADALDALWDQMDAGQWRELHRARDARATTPPAPDRGRVPR